MSDQPPIQTVTVPQSSPVPEDYTSWNDYWTKAHNQPWRVEPEIDEERQWFLATRRATQPDIENSIYPFRDKNGSIKLNRADVEWLLATHESGDVLGPVDWSDTKQRRRQGIDLRGAELSDVDLTGLPLARLHGGLYPHEWVGMTPTQRSAAGIKLERATLVRIHLEGASLNYAKLYRANLYKASLELASFISAHLEGANLFGSQLAGANLRAAVFDADNILYGTTLYNDEYRGIWTIAVRWGGADLSAVDWSRVKMLGDERIAHDSKGLTGRRKTRGEWLYDYDRAVRANRRLATVLREQGLQEEADRFSYRALALQRTVLRIQLRWLRYFGSLVLWLISGYGYKPMRSLIAYILIVCAFATAYLINAQFAAPHLTWDEALVLSISAFHGRGFFTSGISLGDTLARLAAGEAIIGLLIEITFIATFTQRFFAR